MQAAEQTGRGEGTIRIGGQSEPAYFGPEVEADLSLALLCSTCTCVCTCACPCVCCTSYTPLPRTHQTPIHRAPTLSIMATLHVIACSHDGRRQRGSSAARVAFGHSEKNDFDSAEARPSRPHGNRLQYRRRPSDSSHKAGWEILPCAPLGLHSWLRAVELLRVLAKDRPLCFALAGKGHHDGFGQGNHTLDRRTMGATGGS